MPDFQFLRRRVYSAAKHTKNGTPNPRYDTSDVAQESVMQLLHEVDGQIKEVDDLELNEAYLQKVGRGNAHRMLRSHLAQRRSLARESHDIEMAAVQDGSRDPMNLVQDRENIVSLIRCISQLEPQQRTIIYRRFFDLQSFAEIAVELNLSRDGVRRRCDKAIQSLKCLLGG